ncbi:MAG: hypothetical protein QM753_07540 [Thermomicrobiales bacterium]
MACLNTEPAKRPGSMSQLADQLMLIGEDVRGGYMRRVAAARAETVARAGTARAGMDKV